MMSNVRNSGARRGLVVLGCVLALGGVLVACDDDGADRAMSRGTGTAAPAAAAGAAAEAAKDKPPADTLSFKDDDFVESEHNRDPFRSYASTVNSGKIDADAPLQRRVIMPTTAVESMRLMAVISGMPRPKAMLIDSLGVGYVVERGDFVGRGKVLQTSGSVQMVLNWRVDRIRENEVVLTRADATDPTRPPLTRIITMRDEVAAK